MLYMFRPFRAHTATLQLCNSETLRLCDSETLRLCDSATKKRTPHSLQRPLIVNCKSFPSSLYHNQDCINQNLDVESEVHIFNIKNIVFQSFDHFINI